jgi:hypothetical protein
MRAAFYAFFFVALLSCTTAPAYAPGPPDVPPVVRELPQWAEMCDRQPDSPACICLVKPGTVECNPQ